jgi:hypothetical protein
MMHLARVFSFGCFIALFAALAAPNEVVAQKKKGKAVDNGYAALPEDYKTIQNKKELTGEIVAVSGLVVTLRVDTPKVEANPKYKAPSGAAANSAQNRLWQDGQRLQQDYQRAMNAKNPVERQRQLQRYQLDLARYQNDVAKQNQQLLAKSNKVTDNKNNTTDPFIVVHSFKEFDLETADKLAVRKMFLPMEFDDMGNVKTYTDKQKSELKDPKGGYVSKLDEAAPGMEARLLLTAPPKKAKDKETKDKETKADDEPGASIERPTINTIVLLKDSPSSGNIPAADPKKKKK